MKNTIIYFALISLLFSCSDEIGSNMEINDKTDQAKSSETEKSFIYFLTSEKKPGSLLFQNNKNMNSELADNLGICTISEVRGKQLHLNDSIQVRIKDESIQLENLLPFTDNAIQVKDLFGSTLQLSYYDPVNELELLSSDLYLPETLDIGIDTYLSSDINSSNIALKNGSKLTWNVDKKDSNGVHIHLCYNPIEQLSHEMIANNMYAIEKVIIVDDINGNYSFTQNDLSDFPINSIINISVSRGNYVDDYDLLVGGYARTNISSKYVE